VTLKGEKQQETEHKDKNYTVSERSYGSYRRSFSLPDGVDRDKISAEFGKDVLTVKLPKTAAAVAEWACPRTAPFGHAVAVPGHREQEGDIARRKRDGGRS
jgi:hypothetical protein